jgi:putative acetyltransferase
VLIRDERGTDHDAIRAIVADAFKRHPHGGGHEHLLVDALREAGVLTLSLVAEENAEIVGHVAVSPVRIGGTFQGWYGLGPVAVRPDRQGKGIGQALVRAGLDRLRALGAEGCVVLGEPAFYGRFGFKADSRLRLDGVPPEYFLALPFGPTVPGGAVEYHEAFALRLI